jgi:hypothetical protein
MFTASTEEQMFTRRELLILSWCVDRDTTRQHEKTDFFTEADARSLLDKIHNMLKAEYRADTKRIQKAVEELGSFNPEFTGRTGYDD